MVVNFINGYSPQTRILPFLRTRPDSTIFWYSHSFYQFSILVRIVFQYLHRFYLFPMLSWILPFFGTHTDWTLFRYSSEQFFDTRTDSTFSWYSPGFFFFRVLTLIGPFSSTHPNRFWILARILLFLGIHSDSAIFRFSH